MRIHLAGAFCATTICLAACGQGSAFDNGIRTSFRENAVSSCMTASRNVPNSSQFDWPRLCGCAIDRYMAGKSTSDLRSADPHDPALRAATEHCAMEQVGGAISEGSGAAPANAQEDSGKPAD